ncbi:MAG TPA: POTRA domain-containing protein, partial [Polyangiaceae bacterium]|nr:POTRA domain-containing protein [Polyangiaceae bacterium]
MNLRTLACLSLLASLTFLSACAGAGANLRPGLAAEIELTGNHAFDDATLREVARAVECDGRHAIDAVIMAAPEGAPHPCKSPEDLADTLEHFYVERGYLGAHVRVSGGGKAGRPRFEIEEGELFRLGALDVVEADLYEDDTELAAPQELAALLPLRPGEPYSGRRVRAALEALRRRYVAAGYVRANVTPSTSISTDAFRIDLCFEIERGARAPAAPG